MKPRRQSKIEHERIRQSRPKGDGIRYEIGDKAAATKLWARPPPTMCIIEEAMPVLKIMLRQQEGRRKKRATARPQLPPTTTQIGGNLRQQGGGVNSARPNFEGKPHQRACRSRGANAFNRGICAEAAENARRDATGLKREANATLLREASSSNTRRRGHTRRAKDHGSPAGAVGEGGQQSQPATTRQR